MSRVDILAPAPFLTAREILAGNAGLKPLLARAASLQLACADTFGLAVAGELLVVMGFWRHGEAVPAELELFMACAAPARVRPHAVALVAAGRLIVSRVRQDANVGRLFARVSPGASVRDQSGRRLARAVGLGASVPTAAPGPFLEVEMTAFPAALGFAAGAPSRTPMTFSDALAHIKQGKVAWRTSWAPELGHELRVVDGRLVRFEPHGNREWLPQRDDLFADDWDTGPELAR